MQTSKDDPDADIGLDFYCPKCYDMVNYFIDEWGYQASNATKLAKLYKSYKKGKEAYAKKYRNLRFEFDEIKSLKDDLEEKQTACDIKISLLENSNRCLLGENDNLRRELDELKTKSRRSGGSTVGGGGLVEEEVKLISFDDEPLSVVPSQLSMAQPLQLPSPGQPSQQQQPVIDTEVISIDYTIEDGAVTSMSIGVRETVIHADTSVLQKTIEHMTREKDLAINQFASEKRRFEAQVDELTRQLRDKSSELARIERELADTREKCEAMSSELSKSTANEETNNQNGQSAVRIGALEAGLQAAFQDREIFEVETAKLRGEIKRKVEETRALTEEVEAARSSATSLEELAEQMMINYEQQLNECKFKINQMSQLMEDSQSRVSGLESEKSNLMQDLATLKETHQRHLNELKERIEALESEKTELEKLQTQNNTQLENYKSDEQQKLAESKRLNEKFTQEIDQLKSTIEDLRKNLAEIQEAKTSVPPLVVNVEPTPAPTNNQFDNDIEMEVDTCAETEKPNNSSETPDMNRVKSLEAEISRLKADNSSLKLEHETLNTNTNTLKREHETKVNQLIGEIDRVNAELKTERERADETLKALACDVDRLNTQLAESTCVKSKLVNEKNQLVDKIETLNAQLNEIRAEKQRLTTEIDGLNTKLEEIEAERLKALQAPKIDPEMEEKMRQLEIERDQVRLQLKVERQVSESSAIKIGSLSSEIEHLKARLAETETSLERERHIASDKSAMVQTKQVEINALCNRLEQSQCEIGKLKSELKHEVRAFEDKLAALGGENQSLRKTGVALTSQIESLNETVEAMRREWNAEKRAFDEERSDMEAKSRQLIDCVVQLDETSSLLRQFRNSCQDLEIRNAELIKEMTAKEDSIREMRSEIVHLSEANASLKREHEEMSQTYETIKEEHRVQTDEFNARLQTHEIEWNERSNAYQAQIEHLQGEMFHKIEDFELQKSTMSVEYEKRTNELERRIGETSRELATERERCRAYHEEIEYLRNEVNGLTQALSTGRAEAESAILDLSAEVRVLQAQLECVRATEATLADEKMRLVAQIDGYHRQVGEIEARFCEAISEKEKLFKEIVELNKRQAERGGGSGEPVEFKTKIEEKLEQLQTRIEKTKRMSGQFRTSLGGTLTDMNESLVARRFDNHFETVLQNKLNEAIDKNTQYLIEIQSLKSENARLAKERRAFRDDHVQNKQHQATIKQHLKEIARLNDEIKILKDTNGFLSDQIAFLNQQLADVTSNKENNDEENKSTTTVCSGVDSSYSRNLARSNLAKKLYASGGSEYSASPRPLDTNRIVAPDDEAPTSETAATSAPTKDPGASKVEASVSPKKNLLESRLEETPMTPSTLAKQNQCKQQ